MSLSPEKLELLKNYRERMNAIASRSLNLTGELAKANILSILRRGNASAPPIVQIPEEEIEQLKELIVGVDDDENES